jgi:hypothetical protein
MVKDLSEWIDRLGHLPRRLCAAFGVACAQRVLRIYELDYDETNRAPYNAVELTWEYACGKNIDPARLAAAREAASKATPKLEIEGDEHTAPMLACVSAIYALDAVQDPTCASAARAASAAREAAESFTEYDGKGLEAERQWQEFALALVESWGSKPIDRHMFAALDDEPPRWFLSAIG